MAWYDNLDTGANTTSSSPLMVRPISQQSTELTAPVFSREQPSAPVVKVPTTQSTINVRPIPEQQTKDLVAPEFSRTPLEATPIQTRAIQPTAADSLTSFNPNVDTTPLNAVNTDLSKSITGITEAGDPNALAGAYNTQAGLRQDNPYMADVDTALSQLRDYSTGDSQADRTAANIALSRLDASAASANLAQAQRIAANPYMTEGAKRAAGAELLRSTNAQRAEVVGDLAQQAQERAFQATQKVADVAQVAANFKEGNFQFDVTKAGEALSRNLQSQIAAGQLTSQQASMELDKASTLIGEASAAKLRELDKLKTLADNEVEKAQIDIDKARFAQEQYSYWMSNAAGTVMSMYDTNPDLTATDVVNDPAAMKSFTIAYQNMPGNEGKLPNETEISTMMLGMKPEWMAEKENYQRNWNTTESALRTAGASDETVSYMKDLVDLTNATGGAVSILPDGSISLVGADGNPVTYTDEYGQEQELTFGGTGTSGKSVLTSLNSVFTEQGTNKIIGEVVSGTFSNVDSFVTAMRQRATDEGKALSTSTEDLKKIYNDIKSGKLKETVAGQVATTEEGFKIDPNDVWTDQNEKILSDPSDPNFGKVLDAMISDVVNGTGKNNFLLQLQDNPRLMVALWQRGNLNVMPNSASIRPGDIYVASDGNLRLSTGNTENEYVLLDKMAGADKVASTPTREIAAPGSTSTSTMTGGTSSNRARGVPTNAQMAGESTTTNTLEEPELEKMMLEKFNSFKFRI